MITTAHTPIKFSIITCTLNSEKYLEKNINSVKSQTFTNYEHIFIDGFSSDNTLKIIKKYQKNNPDKIKLFQYQPTGIADAMNKGILHAKGKYVNHLHSDDSFYSHCVLEQLNQHLSKNHDPDWVYGKANFFIDNEKNGCIIPHRQIYHQARFLLLLMTNYIPHQAVFIKKQVFDKVGLFDTHLKNSMDYEFWLRLTANGYRSSFFNNIVCNFSLRKDSQSQKFRENSLKERLILIKKYSPPLIYQTIKLINLINNQLGIRIKPDQNNKA